MEPHRIFPHGHPEAMAPGLWRVVGSLPFPLKRNMFVYRLPDGGLLLDSVIAMDEAGMAALEQLGKPTVMVIPHPGHTMDARFYHQRYPHMQVVGAADAQEKLAEIKVEPPEKALPPLGITPHTVAGLKVTELVLELPLSEGRALVCADAFGQTEGKPGLMMKLMGPPGGAGVARIVKLRQLADKAKLRDFLLGLSRVPDVKIVAGAHGGWVHEDCAGWLRRAAEGV